MRYREKRVDRWSSLVWGLGLIGLGVVFMLHFMGRVEWMVWRVWWPAIVVAMGFLQTLTARSAHKLGSGVTLMGIGAWLLVATNRWYGLDWHNSWPLALVAVGLGSIARVAVSPFMPARSSFCDVEVEHDDHD